MKKIKVSANWDTSENVVERLIRQFKTPNINLSDIEFVSDDSYDIIVFFNYVNQPIKINSKSYVFPNEPSWSGSHQKSFDSNTTVFGFKQNLYNGNFIESVSHTFYGGRGPWVDSLDFWSYENLKEFKFNKSKNISSSITRLKIDNGLTCLYPQRFIISKLIDKLPFIDFFGCKNIREIYPEDGYILIDNIDDLTSIENLLINIEKNADKIYNEKIIGLRKIKERYFKEFNLLKKIIDL